MKHIKSRTMWKFAGAAMFGVGIILILIGLFLHHSETLYSRLYWTGGFLLLIGGIVSIIVEVASD